MQNIEHLPLLDINEWLIEDLPATFLVRVTGDSMIGAGILSGDLLVVDKGRRPMHGSIVIAAVDGQFTVKRLHRKDGRITLVPENPLYPTLEFQSEQEVEFWGCVIGCVRRFAYPSSKRRSPPS